jgi:hypothetical protein
MVGADPADLPFDGPDQVVLSPTHTVAGNPNRHDTGVVRLRADDQWRTTMALRDRAVVTLLTAVGLRRFRYSLRTTHRPGPTRRLATTTASSPEQAH